MDEQLNDARKILENAEQLLKKYPHSFSMNIKITQWKQIVEYLESKINEESKSES